MGRHRRKRAGADTFLPTGTEDVVRGVYKVVTQSFFGVTRRQKASAVMLLERGIRDISRVLVLARNSVYSARSVEDAIPHVYKMEGHRSLRENPLILSS